MPLTTTSYAILGLLDLRDWTAYDLTQQARRSLAYAWPISESQLYAEPKRLAEHGLITIRNRSAGPRRTRQLLHITANGRRELRRWLASEPAAPRVQMEALLRTLFATAGSKADLLAVLDATERSVRLAYDEGRTIAAAYRIGDNPFPERLHVNLLWMVFVRDLLLLTLEWVSFVRAEVAGWPEIADPGNPRRLRKIIDAVLADDRLLLGSGTLTAEEPGA